MLFTTWVFGAFLCIVLLLHRLLPRTARTPLLLVSSYIFYGWWDWRFCALVALTTWIDWFAALRIHEARERADALSARRWLQLSLAANLGILGFFKYFNFFVDSFRPLVGALFSLPDGPFLEIILPVGISFYVFQSLSYTIDVYRGHLPVQRSLLVFATYVMFFPQLVAGPIERSTNLMPQIESPAPVVWEDWRYAMAMILLGLFKKMAVGDVIAPLADRLYAAQAATTAAGTPGLGAAVLLCAIYLFAIQIYMDFSGYSDIARGSSRLFGIRLMRNFNAPYLAQTVTEFWQRWHISLSTWFRDYVYGPLRGKRRTDARLYGATVGTMALAGLWHGASWNFVIWGTYFGLLQAWERFWNATIRKRYGVPSIPGTTGALIGFLLTFHLVVVSLVLFRHQTLGAAVGHFMGLLDWRALAAGDASVIWSTAGLLALMFAMHWEEERTGRDEFFFAYPPLACGLVMGAMLVATIYWSDLAGAPFIYFQF